MSEPDPHPAAREEAALLAECEMRRQRRSGPGGQHRNKVETAVLLTHRPTGVSAEASERRSQAENRRVAVRRLRINLAMDVRRSRQSGSSPSPVWQSRCAAGKISVSPDHPDFPGLLAEALDALAAHEWDATAAAHQLGCSMSQLVKFLKLEPRALALLNQRRARLGLRTLR